MHSFQFPQKRLITIGSLLLAGLVLLRWVTTDETQATERNDGRPAVIEVGSPENGVLDATAAARPPREPKAARKPVDSERSWEIADEGGRSFVLALDEAFLRDADGKETMVKLDPPATEDTLPQRLAALALENDRSAWPVVYLAGEPRSEASRRLLTPDLRIRLDGADPVAVARAAAVEIKDLPEYAPGWAVLAAADPFAALVAMDRLRAAGHPTADVLLAARRQKRAMPNDTLINNQWHLKNTNSTRTHINVESAWNYPNTGIRGAGIRIGIVDDGLQTLHPDLAANVDTVNDKDWNGNDSDPNPGTGDDHGTACAGNAGARGNNSLGVSGSAPESTLVGLRLIAGSVTDAQEAEAMAWSNDIIQIKSNSWGPGDTGTILEGPGSLTAAALQNATTMGRGGKGTIILWAAGNGGGSSDNSNYDGYANSIHTISIGASNSNGNRASYSEPGANVVVVAPSNGGTGITTTDRTGSVGYSSSDYTSTFGGTSSATPTAAGVVALMLEKNPTLGWRDVQEILIRSAFKIKPTDADWTNNGAGIPFNHNFGAGLIDATAAANLANGWVNLTNQQSVPLAQSGLSVAIPDNNSTGIARTFDFSASNLRVEHVTVRLSITHAYRGDLAVTLTSPSGMTSRLAEKRSDSNGNYSNWTFSSVRHWGESSAGNWTLKIADTTAANTGTLTSAALTLYGTPATTANPAPLVQITSPVNGAVFSPGATVNVAVNASDLTQSGSPGTISQVELLQNGSVVGTDANPPYLFAITPAIGNHTLVARATDNEGAVANSASIPISVINQTPVITAATLSAGPQGYADEGLTVNSISASDPENDNLAYQYQWQAGTDGVVFTNVPAATTASLAPAPNLAGKLWRCVVTVSDASTTSAPFTTAATNLLNRPPATAEIGAAFAYNSGLVLRGSGSTLTRRAIIHEFSQGPAGGSAEWIEILTLQSGSLAFWDIQDAGGTMLVFLDAPVWENIPAGTLIVIYNGTVAKDPLLPADDTNPADGRMVLSSTNPAFFDDTYDAWPSLGNSGDAIFLGDGDSNTVHEIAYGNSTAATPNIGTAGSGKAAYYTGSNDGDANLAASWSVTTSLTARAFKALLPGVSLAGGNYSQNFNTAPGASGTTYPDGWTSYDGAMEDTSMSSGNSASTVGGNYNYGSRIGILGSGSAFDPASIVLAIRNTTGSSGLNIAYDVVKIREQARSNDLILQYSLTSPTGGFTDIPGGNYLSGSLAENHVSSFAVPLPAALDNYGSTIYLRWYYQTNSGSGSRDGLALDNVVISSGPVTPPLTLAVSPATIVENAGGNAATGTVTIPAARETNLVVTLTTSDPGEAAVPASVTVIAGNTSANFAVDAINDLDSDGPQTVVIGASAEGYQPATFEVTVTDDEPSLTGVTPGSGNTPANIAFVNQLRSAAFGNPALFRFGTGIVPPVGLTLEPQSGLLTGIIAASNPPGAYPIVIERYNSQNETVSQAFTLTLSGGTGGDFAAWIAGYPEVGSLNGRLDDFDGDGLPNAVENLLGTSPSAWNAGLVEVSASGGSLVFHHTFAAQPASDVTRSYQWSPDLVNWHASGAESGGIIISITSEVVTDAAHPQGWMRVTASATQGSLERCFVRLRAD